MFKRSLVVLMLISSQNVYAFGGIVDAVRSVKDIVNTTKEANDLRKEVQGIPSNTGSNSGVNSQYKAGDLLYTKMNGVKLYSRSTDKSALAGKLSKHVEVIFTGKSENGFSFVKSESGEGWIESILIGR